MLMKVVSGHPTIGPRQGETVRPPGVAVNSVQTPGPVHHTNSSCYMVLGLIVVLLLLYEIEGDLHGEAQATHEMAHWSRGRSGARR